MAYPVNCSYDVIANKFVCTTLSPDYTMLYAEITIGIIIIIALIALLRWYLYAV
jgi:hypothetical protein